MCSQPPSEHILIGEDKVPRITGTNMKVVELIEKHIAFSWSSEEFHLNHPYLSMGQLHSALELPEEDPKTLKTIVEGLILRLQLRRIQPIAELAKSYPVISELADQA